MDGDGVEISRVKTGGIPNPELGKAQELVVFFSVQRLVGFCGKFRDWWLLFRLFT